MRGCTRKKNEWYATEIHRQLHGSIQMEGMNVKLRLSVIKLIHLH